MIIPLSVYACTCKLYFSSKEKQELISSNVRTFLEISSPVLKLIICPPFPKIPKLALRDLHISLLIEYVFPVQTTKGILAFFKLLIAVKLSSGIICCYL